MSPPNNYSVGVVGAGSWGSAIANLLAEKGIPVALWVYEQELCRTLKDTLCNTMYLPDIILSPDIVFTGDLAEAVADKDVVFWVTPVAVFRDVFSRAAPQCGSRAIHVSASKGIENDTLKTVSGIAADSAGTETLDRFVVLSGPSFAKEVSKKMPTAAVVASADSAHAACVQEILATPFFRTYTSTDVCGVELGGSLKNVIAIAAGVIEGLGFGHNTRAALITRGLAEIIRLGTALGADPMTFAGLSGMGDLVLTCTSTLSRNYSVGVKLGRGETLDRILGAMTMVAEGVFTARSAYALSEKNGVDMPIVQEMYRILFENKPPQEALKDLMGRELRHETD
jgi:glycerol-3-phosphate dehydrogenase (NAD(P)+)